MLTALSRRSLSVRSSGVPRPKGPRVRRAAVALLASTSLLLAAGCSGDEPAAPSDPNAPITLKISTFGNSDALKKLADKYHQEHPNITVELATTANVEDARTNLLTKLAAGTGLADLEMLEISWTGELKQYSSKFVPVEGDQGGDYVKVQSDPVTDADGKLFAYGLGTGPEAICYRADLLQKAGLPTDPESVAKLVGGTWADYFAAGEKYLAGGGQGAWYDASYSAYNAQIEQLAFPYESADGTIVADNPEVEKIFRDTLAVAPRLSAKLAPFSEDWNAGIGSGKFATMTCPSWMLTVIEGNAKKLTDWRVANAFPGGGGNVGGSYMSVPTQSKYPEQAKALAAWITAPEQQIAAFKDGSAFPSRTQALESPSLQEVVNPYFGDAKVGAIYADRSKAITTVIYKGPHYLAIDTAAINAMTRVESGQQTVDEGWTQFVTEAKAAGQ